MQKRHINLAQGDLSAIISNDDTLLAKIGPLASQARRWTTARHGDQENFYDRLMHLMATHPDAIVRDLGERCVL